MIGKTEEDNGTDEEESTKVAFEYVNAETIDINGSKTWDDDDNRDGVRP